MDNVPIQFRKVIDNQGLLDDEELLNRIANRLDELNAQGA
jgi:formylmethanofuran dehydrogenase subunit B